MSEDRYWTLDRCDKAGVPFNFIIGGRGTGKTYATLSRCIDSVSNENRFLYLRRIETEVASLSNDRYNPFKKLNYDKGYGVKGSYNMKFGVGEFTRANVNTDGEETEELLGYATALSTFGKLRGADLSDTNKIVFDEFQRLKSSRPLPEEADLFFNLYETISRNREVEGKPPVVCYFLSNSVSINSPLLAELNLVTVIEHMRDRGQQYWTDKRRGVHIELLSGLKISEEKRDTALYRLTRGSAYSKHALDNEFIYDSFENIERVNINEYRPYIQLDDMYIYQHKSRCEFYITYSKNKCRYKYVGDSIPLFKRYYGLKFTALSNGGYCRFENIAIKKQFESYLMIRR